MKPEQCTDHQPAEAVADHRLGFDAEVPDDVAHGATRCDLAEDDRLVVVVEFCGGGTVPEKFGLELTPQMEVLPVLPPENLRPPKKAPRQPPPAG